MREELFACVYVLLSVKVLCSADCWTKPCLCCRSGECADPNDTTFTCDGCIDGYTRRNCFEPCSTNCVNCTQNFFDTTKRICYTCKHGFYNGRYQDNKELPLENDCTLSCRNYCESCTSYYNCLQCKSGYYMGLGKECKECPAHCARCSSATNCLQCKNGYFMEVGACRKCNLNCKTCLSRSQCIACDEDFFLEMNECKLCQSGCKFCNGINACINCHTGYYLTNGMCLRCSDGCTNCSFNNLCNECHASYFLYNGTCNRCGSKCLNCLSDIDCKNCENGYQVYEGKCYECPSSCTACSSDNICTACIQKLFILNGHCYPCPNSCLSCSSNEYCTTCIGGFFGHNCTRNCPPNCLGKTCNHTTGQCLACNTGYYMNDKKECINCRVNCVGCTSWNSCTVCKNKYYGEYCQDECSNCKAGSSCNKTNGYCFEGCKDGFSGYMCELKCDQKCFSCDRENRSVCTLYVCANDTDGTKPSSRPCNYRKNECVAGHWGTQCEYRCAKGCRGNICKRENGSCTHGCADDFTITKDGYCETSCEENNLPVMVLSVALALSVVVIIILILYIILKSKRRQRRNRGSFEKAVTQGVSQDAVNGNCTESIALLPAQQTKQEYTHVNNGKTQIEINNRKIALQEIEQYVKEKQKDYFKDEFEEIKSESKDLHTERVKRVILPDDQYVNAYPVKGYLQDNAYIVLTGPTIKYRNDMSFWSLVWQENCDAIVMLTSHEDDDTEVKEWSAPKSNPAVIVSLKYEEVFPSINCTRRGFILKKDEKDGSEKREVTHLQFTFWTTTWTQDDVKRFVELRQKVRSIPYVFKGPTLIHSSDDQGYIGTYIAFDTLMEEGLKEGNVDIFSRVRDINQKAAKLQNATQYEFLHHALIYARMAK